MKPTHTTNSTNVKRALPLLGTLLLFTIFLLLSCDDLENDHKDQASRLAESPFISRVSIALPAQYQNKTLANTSFEVARRPGTFAKTVKATYSSNNKELSYDGKTLGLPVFGLYENYNNNVKVTVNFNDGATYSQNLSIETPSYNPDNSKRSPLEVVKAPTQVLDYSFMLFENNVNPKFSTDRGPEIYDIDGYIRWARPDLQGKGFGLQSSLYQDGKIIINIKNPGNELAIFPLYQSKNFDEISFSIPSLSGITPHHETSAGKNGYLLNITATKNDKRIFQSILVEVDKQGKFLKQWDFGQILRDYITANGSETEKKNMEADFIRDGVDWAHMNSAIYSDTDNSIIASLRELFIIKINYDTGVIQWLFGDKTKHWYVNYPSLHSLVLTINGEGEVPIGQHALSIPTIEGKKALMFFNNGKKSTNFAEGTPAGKNLTKSLAMAYEIDDAAKTAKQLWQYDASLYSSICSSVYKQNKDYLITYSAVGVDGSNPQILIQGVRGQTELFSFKLEGSHCNPWNSEIVQLHDLQYP